MVQHENFVFVMNVASIPRDHYEIFPGWILRRATSYEKQLISKTLNKPGVPGFSTILWETTTPGRTQTTALPESEWRYHVLTLPPSSDISDLQAASDLAEVEVEFGFFFVFMENDSYSVASLPARVYHVLDQGRFDETFFVSMREDDFKEIQAIHALLQTATDVVNVRQLVRQLSALKALPHGSPLRFLGYFAVLESLLTHPPLPSDPYSSITRQVKKKIELLNNRWNRPINYEPFGGAAPEKVWGKMYDYRSALAHGGTPDFSKDLKMLVDAKVALRLLRSTVKSVLRQALIEPILIRDLREC